MKHDKIIGRGCAISGAVIILLVGILAFQSDSTAQTPDQTSNKDRGFGTMAVAPDKVAACTVPKVPKELGIVPIRNAYTQILRIMALEKAKASGSCDCAYGLATWDEVVKASPGFERTDGTKVRFDNVKLRLRADALEADIKTACGN